MKVNILFFTIFFLSKINAQVDSVLIKREEKLTILLNELRAASTNKEKESKNLLFKEYLLESIKLDKVIDYPFLELKTLGSVKSDDNKIRLFTWNVEQDDHSQKYYCYILRLDSKKKKYVTSELIDNSFMIPARPDGILEAKDWYGALYYKVINISKGNKEMYTLLGYDMNTTMSSIKLIDVLTFSGNIPRLGAPIFKMKEGVLKRVFYEHSEKAIMSLKYEEQYKRIIFDHLSPEDPSMNGFYSYYVPDFIYDAFVFQKDKWIFVEDVIGINGEDKKELSVYVQNKRTGKLAKKTYKNKWEAPSDIYVAKTPDQIGSGENVPPPKKRRKIKLFREKSDKYSMYPGEINPNKSHKKRDHRSQ